MADTDIKAKVAKVIDTVKTEVPEVAKENKGAIIGAVAGYFLAGFLDKHQEVVTSVLGGLVGHAIDEKSKESK